jgi:hypothetical protein
MNQLSYRLGAPLWLIIIFPAHSQPIAASFKGRSARDSCIMESSNRHSDSLGYGRSWDEKTGVYPLVN